MCFLHPTLTKIAPALAVLGDLLQLVTGQLDGTVGRPRGGKHAVKSLHGFIQVDLDTLLDAEGTHAADGMADHLGDLVGGEHLGLGVEGRLKLGVIHFRIPGGDDQDGLAVHLERQGFGDAGRNDPRSFGGQPRPWRWKRGTLELCCPAQTGPGKRVLL